MSVQGNGIKKREKEAKKKSEPQLLICHIFYGTAATQQVWQHSCGEAAGGGVFVLSSRGLSLIMNHTENK